MGEVEYPRQGEPTLEAALSAAIRELRAREVAYRNPRGPEAKRMSKQQRQALAATLADYCRLLSDHLSRRGEEGEGA